MQGLLAVLRNDVGSFDSALCQKLVAQAQVGLLPVTDFR